MTLFLINVKNCLPCILVLNFKQRSLTSKQTMRSIRMVGHHLVVHLYVQVLLRRKRGMGHGIPDVLQSASSSTVSSPVVQVGTLSHFLNQWTRDLKKLHFFTLHQNCLTHLPNYIGLMRSTGLTTN